MNINQQNQKENRQDFQIDQNEQNINRLRKQTKALSDNIDTLSQSALVSQTDISSIKTDLATAKSDIEQLKSSGSTTEEKVELLSYDIIKVVDNTYCDAYWEPMRIYFFAEKGSKVKIHLKFDIVNTFLKNFCPITTTTTIMLDGKTIKIATNVFEEPSTAPFDLEYVFTSNSPSHCIHIKIDNGRSASSFSTYTKPDFFIFEIYGTNVQIITRNNDFRVSSSDSKALITTSCIDQYARYSLQNIDANLSLNSEMFLTKQLAEWRYPNNIWPFMYYNFDADGNVVHSAEPSFIWSAYKRYDPRRRIFYKINLTADETITTTTTLRQVTTNATAVAPTLKNKSLQEAPYVITISEDNKVFFYKETNGNCEIQNTDEIFVDCAGVWRIDNFSENVDPMAIITKNDGTNFLFIPTFSVSNNQTRYELGFGTNVNAYLRSDNSIEVFMRVGKNTKKLILKTDETDNHYKVISKSIIPDVQEYWLVPNGFHFERRGNVVGFYSDNSENPLSIIEMFY